MPIPLPITLGGQAFAGAFGFPLRTRALGHEPPAPEPNIILGDPDANTVIGDPDANTEIGNTP